MADELRDAELQTLSSDVRALIGEVATVVRTIEQTAARGTSQTIIHKSSMGGFVAGLAVAACVGSFFFSMYATRTLTNEIRDLSAWRDVYGRDLAAVKQYITQQKEKGQ